MDTRPTPDLTRREGVATFPITLADGNAWGLSLPSPRLRLTVVRGIDALGRPTETVQVATSSAIRSKSVELVEDLRSACEQASAGRQYEALIRLVVALLRRAHDIDLTEAASLLELGVGDLPRFVETVVSVVTGECLEMPVPPKRNDNDVTRA